MANQAYACPCKIECTRINVGNDIFDWKSHILRSTNQENAWKEGRPSEPR